MIKQLFRASLLILLLGQASAQANGAVEIEDAWVRSAPPNVGVMAGYLRITNNTDDAVTLTNVSSRQFEQIEIHRSVTQNNIAHMQNIDPLTLAGKQEILFEPGSFHLMLMNPRDPVREGDVVHFVFEFSNGQELMVDARVRDSAPAGSDEDSDTGDFRHHH